jgi:hypothetical protein
MIENFIFMIIYVCILVYGFRKHKGKLLERETIVFMSIMVINGIMVGVFIFKLDRVNPLYVITYIFKPFGTFIYSLFL